MRIAIVTTAFDPLAEWARFDQANSKSGATASFVGRCRSDSNGTAVNSLELEHYPGFTESTIATFVEGIAARLALRDVAVIHRVGAIAPGDAIVLVAAASAHRAPAFKAVEEIMDFLKTGAPFWKREVTAAGAAWIEPTALDQRRGASRNTT